MKKASYQNLPELLTITDVSTILKCNPATLRNWDKDGTLKALRIGKRRVRRYKREAIEHLLQTQAETEQVTGEDDILPTSLSKTIAENASLGLLMKDDRQFCIYMNPAAEKITGFTLKQVKEMNKPLHEILHHIRPDGTFYPESECPVDSALPQRNRMQGETFFVRPDGSFYPVSYVASPISKGDQTVGTIIEIQDLTEDRKKTQELEHLYNNAPAGYHSLDKNGVFVRINKTELEMLGYTKEEIIGKKKFSDLLTAKSKAAFKENFLRFKKDGTVSGAEFEMVRKDGTIMHTLLNAVALTDDLGRFVMSQSTIYDITQRKQSERELYTYKDIFQHAHIGIAISDGETGNIAMVNQAYATMHGYTVEELQGTPILSLFPQHIRKEVRKLVLQANKTGNLVIETEHIRKDGSVFPVYADATAVKDSKGHVLYRISNVIDITERKQAEEQLKRFKFMSDHANDAFILMREDGTFAYLNEVACKRWGYTQEEAKMLHVPDVDPIYNDKKFREIFALAQKQKVPTFETLHKRKDGSIYPVEVNMIGLTLDRKPHLFAIARDITDRKKAEHLLEQQASLIELARNAIFVWEYDGIITYWNKGAEELYGYSKTEAVGKNVHNLLQTHHPQGMPSVKRQLKETKRWEGQLEHRTQDGRKIIVDSRQGLIQDNAGTLLVLETNLDITQRLRLERQKDEFIGVASHELKTPVTSIKAYTQVLQQMFQRRGETQSVELLMKMDAQIGKLTTLISDLLDVTKIEAGKLQFREDFFDFNDLVEEIVEEIQRTALRHRIKIKVVGSKEVFGDRDRIGQVITNFLTNAIKYSPHAKDILVKTRVDKSDITLCVQDFGVGIAKEKQKRVFERFYRVDGRNEETYPGLGLGLFISKEIITRQGGRIWVESEEGKGSIFCFCLPIQKRKLRQQKDTLSEDGMKHE